MNNSPVGGHSFEIMTHPINIINQSIDQSISQLHDTIANYQNGQEIICFYGIQTFFAVFTNA
jgi:hypothetical protein